MDQTQEHVEGQMSMEELEGCARTYGAPTPGQLERINSLAKRELSAEELFVFPGKLVGDMVIPNRYIQIDKSLLEVFREDAKSGIAFMLDHPWTFLSPKPALPYGRTFDAVLKKSDVEGEAWALYADHYIVRGKEKDGISTDSIIADIEDGTLFDTSIGWGAKTFECSICGNDIRRLSECEHYPGRTYEGNVCYAIAKPPGFLMENSGVFDGAYPTAGLGQAVEGNNGWNGFVAVENIKDVNPDCNVYCVQSSSRNTLVTMVRDCDYGEHISGSIEIMQSVSGDMDIERVAESVASLLNDSKGGFVATTYSAGGEQVQENPKPEESQQGEEDEFMKKEQVVEVLGSEYSAEEVLAFAKEGLQYRQELIEDTIEWGVRAQGNDFATDAWRQMLSEPSRSIQAIKDFRETFKKQTKEEIPEGRKGDPEATRLGEGQKSEIPDEAFKA